MSNGAVGVCQRCGVAVGPADHFCPNCGTPVDAPAATAGAPASAAIDRPPGKRVRFDARMLLAGGALVAVASLVAWAAWGFLRPDDSMTAAGEPTAAVEGEATPAAEGQAAALGPVDLGGATITNPDPAVVVETAQWGMVPTDRIYVVGVEGAARADFDALATTLGGSITGEIPYLEMYEVSFPAAGEQGLQAALAAAEATPAVDLAFPDQLVRLSQEYVGVRTSPLNDPVYGGAQGRGYQAIGVDKAWTYIKASGLPINGVSVGVSDTALWRGGGEFDSANITFPDPAAGETADPLTWTMNTPDPNGGAWTSNDTYIQPDGGHGTAVAGIIGADGDDGGVAGVASVLGDKLDIAHVDIFGPNYGSFTAAPPDPNDVTQYSDAAGNTWSIGALKGLVRLIESPAQPKIINMSWNCGTTTGECGAEIAAAYKRFFEKMAVDHPDVLFVASAGNNGRAPNGSKAYPGGLALPNMITVGNIDTDSQTVPSSNRTNTTPGEEYEVTVAAPGQQAVRGVRYDGAVVTDETVIGTAVHTDGRTWNVTSGGGTSMAAPQVTATAALLKALDPSLTAGQIKEIIRSSAQTSTAASQNLVDPAMGAGALSVDEAVRAVINKLRKVQGLPELSAEELLNRGVIDSVATFGEGGVYTVVATVTACDEDKGCTGVSIRVDGEHALSGSTTQGLSTPGEVVWTVTLKSLPTTIFLQRTDNGAGSLITIDPVEIAGLWTGTLTLTTFMVPEGIELPDGTTAPPGAYGVDELEQCSAEFGEAIGESITQAIEQLREGLPIQAEFTGTLEEPGTVVLTSNAEPLPPTPWRVEGTSIVFEIVNEEGYFAFSGTVSGMTMTGAWGGLSEDVEFSGVFSLTKVG